MKKVIIIGLILMIGLVVLVYANNSFYSVSARDYQVTIEVKNGWNLVQGFNPDFISAGSQITTSNIKAVFMYSPDKNKYIEIYPNFKLPNAGLDPNDEYYDDESSAYASWVYIENIQYCNDPACEVQGGALDKLVYTIRFGEWNIKIKKGWNFVGINPFMYKGDYNPGECYEGEYFSWDSVAGNCQFETTSGGADRIYAWNPETQEWIDIDFDGRFQCYDFDDFLGAGMLIKVLDDCNLESPTDNDGGTTPPTIPN